jgi:hypothetical protein
MPLYLSKVLRAKERASIPYSSVVFYLGLTFESFKELGVHHLLTIKSSLQKLQVVKQKQKVKRKSIKTTLHYVQTVLHYSGFFVVKQP